MKAATDSATAATHPAILVVDDDGRVVELLELALAARGYRVLKAGDGEEALKCALTERPDLVVLDVRLPRKSGLEVCDFLRQDPERPDLPIIMVSAAGDTEARLEGLARGADDFLVKPFSIRELLVRIQRLLARCADVRGARLRARELERDLARAQDEARRAQAEVRRERRLRDLAFGCGRDLHRTLDLDQVARRLLVAVRSSLGVGVAALLLPERAGGDLVPGAVRGDGFERLAGLELKAGCELALLLVSLGRPVLRRELERFPELRIELAPFVAAGFTLLAPVRGPEGLEALLAADERADGSDLPPADLELLGGLCELAATALANARYLEVEVDRLLEMCAAGAPRGGAEDAAWAEAAVLVQHAARADLLPPRERGLLARGLAFGSWGFGAEAAQTLERLARDDATGRIGELARILAGAAAPEEVGLEAPAEERRAALLLAAARCFAEVRARGAGADDAVRQAVARLGDGLDASTRQALLDAARETAALSGQAA